MVNLSTEASRKSNEIEALMKEKGTPSDEILPGLNWIYNNFWKLLEIFKNE